MKSLQLFLEYRTASEIKYIIDKTNKQVNPEYEIYDEDSMTLFINRYKQNKDQFSDYHIYFCQLKGNVWVINTKVDFDIDLGRMNDKFLSSKRVDYSYDDVLSLLDDQNMLVVMKY